MGNCGAISDLIVEGFLIGIVDGLLGSGFFPFVGLWSRSARCWPVTVVSVEPRDFFSQDWVVGACNLMPVVIPEANEGTTCVESSVVVVAIDQ